MAYIQEKFVAVIKDFEGENEEVILIVNADRTVTTPHSVTDPLPIKALTAQHGNRAGFDEAFAASKPETDWELIKDSLPSVGSPAEMTIADAIRALIDHVTD